MYIAPRGTRQREPRNPPRDREARLIARSRGPRGGPGPRQPRRRHSVAIASRALAKSASPRWPRRSTRTTLAGPAHTSHPRVTAWAAVATITPLARPKRCGAPRASHATPPSGVEARHRAPRRQETAQRRASAATARAGPTTGASATTRAPEQRNPAYRPLTSTTTRHASPRREHPKTHRTAAPPQPPSEHPTAVPIQSPESPHTLAFEMRAGGGAGPRECHSKFGDRAIPLPNLLRR